MKRSDVVRMMQRFSVPVGSDDPEATALGAPPLHQVTDATCPDCGEEITYRSCQQPDTGFIAELALWVHRREVHEQPHIANDGQRCAPDEGEEA